MTETLEQQISDVAQCAITDPQFGWALCGVVLAIFGIVWGLFELIYRTRISNYKSAIDTVAGEIKGAKQEAATARERVAFAEERLKQYEETEARRLANLAQPARDHALAEMIEGSPAMREFLAKLVRAEVSVSITPYTTPRWTPSDAQLSVSEIAALANSTASGVVSTLSLAGVDQVKATEQGLRVYQIIEGASRSVIPPVKSEASGAVIPTRSLYSGNTITNDPPMIGEVPSYESTLQPLQSGKAKKPT